MRTWKDRTSQPVWVKWEDSAARLGWCRSFPHDSLVCESIGFLVEDRPSSIIITTSVMHDSDEHQASCIDPLEIPKRSILELHYIYWKQ